MRRNKIFWFWSIIVIVLFNFLIAQKERILRYGDKIYFKIAPVDPRSIMQGDYMALRYDLDQQVRRDPAAVSPVGYAVIFVDDNGLAHYRRIYDSEKQLAPGERIVKYRQGSNGVRFGAEAYFFQEGFGKYYAGARYAEFRISKAGETVLTRLLDENFKPKGPPPTLSKEY